MKEQPQERRTMWAARRARLGVTIRQLARGSKVAAPYLSLMERGRAIPTSDEYDAIVGYLDRVEQGTA